MSQYLLTSMITLLLLVACGSADTSVAQTNSPQISVGNSCLAKYAMEPEKLISTAEIAAITKVNPSLVEIKPLSDYFKNSKYYTKSEMRFTTFELPSDRKMEVKVGNNTMQVPANNEISVGGIILLEEQERKIEIPYDEWFGNRYSVMTTDEKESFETKVDEELEKRSENTQESKATNELATDFVKKLANAFIYESVEGLGDRATMESMGKFSEVTLHVLHKNVVFNVKVDVSNDKEVNKDIAKEIAKKVALLCN